MVSVALPPAATEVGLKLAVGPAGDTVALRLTVPSEPTCEVLMVLVPLPPCWIDKVLGLAEMEKSAGGGAVTVTATEALCVADPSLPITVTV